MNKVNLFLLLLIFCLPSTASAAENPPIDHTRDPNSESHHVGHDSPIIQKYAEEAQSGPQQNFGVGPVRDNEIFAVFRADRLEYQTREGDEAVLWDVQAWAGNDYNKLWFKSEGLWLADQETFEEAEVELLYSRNISTFWDVQAGVRHDFEPHPTRTFAALGVEGLARYWFEVEATAYVSQHGDVSASFEAEYDLLLTQRLILQPRFESNVSAQDVKDYNIGQGINDVALGARLRYEIRREFAPYVGVSWTRKIGETASLAEADGEDASIVSLVVGLHLWF